MGNGMGRRGKGEIRVGRKEGGGREERGDKGWEEVK